MKVLLVIAYLSMGGVPQINIFERGELNECRKEATRIFNQVRAGSARVWCQPVIKKEAP